MDGYRFSRLGARSLVGLGLLACASVLSVRAASAANPTDGVVYKRCLFEERDGLLTVTGGFREMLDETQRRRLRSGFATTVVMRLYLFDKKGGEPLALAVRSLRAVYDLWDERYLVRIDEARGRWVRRLRHEKQVIDRLTSFWRFPLTSIGQIKRRRQYFVAAIVEVNPMSAEVLREVRSWLRRPSLSPRRRGRESFFGSFVSIFVNNKVRRGQVTFKVRSQPFFRK